MKGAGRPSRPAPALPGQPVSAAHASTSATFGHDRTETLEDPSARLVRDQPAPSPKQDAQAPVPFWAQSRPPEAPPRPARRAKLLSGGVGIAVSLAPIAVLVGLLGVSGVVAVTGTAPPTAVSDAAVSSPEHASALAWLDANLGAGDQVLADRAVADQLPRGLGGVYPRPAEEVTAEATGAWRQLDLVVATPSVRQTATTTPDVSSALANSTLVAAFGAGAERIEIRRVAPEGAIVAAATESAAAEERRRYGAELVRNPSVLMSTPDRVAFAGGDVDARISVILGALSGTGSVRVSDLPVVAGEQSETRRQVAIAALADVPLVVGGQATPEAVELFEGLVGPYALKSMSVDGDALVLTFPVVSRDAPE